MTFEKGHPPYGAAARRVQAAAMRDPIAEAVAEVEADHHKLRTRNEAGQYVNEPPAPTTPIKLSDLTDLWGVGLRQWLCRQWPHLQDGPTLLGRIRGWMSSPGYWFVRCGDSAMLACRHVPELATAPMVNVVFLYHAGQEGRAVLNATLWLYDACARWGALQGAIELRPAEKHSDSGPDQILTALQGSKLLTEPKLYEETGYRIMK